MKFEKCLKTVIIVKVFLKNVQKDTGYKLFLTLETKPTTQLVNNILFATLYYFCEVIF